ncbi:FG-GAP-like repeat-containing protein [Nocardiopsis changdeensis]|uniref:FG-GAP repeat protein n=1 Tax=Nocardiopsis changdeensis TaxID=2831969 RepID=A0ABX8BLP2_9ACTN|nr:MULTISPECIES: FG-GAP-like repeat-containing protein [Nocardiopsis]QUX22473.1 FG-GAP repeat protein [Nocardiopsis changdeensis]QYX38415.1 FG-GAP-like repeat-containing protein [Nocardiopsis sp. MT53]
MKQKLSQLSTSQKWLAAATGVAVIGGMGTYALVAGFADPRATPYDFNGDGYPDLAVGLPGDTLNSHANAGSIAITNGSVTGDFSSGYLLHQDSADVAGAPEKNDSFGQSMASGDFDADGYADLAVGIPFEAIGDVEGAGYVAIQYGSGSGLINTRSQSIHEDSPGIPGTVAKDEVFGYSLATGDLNTDGYDDLVIGMPLDNANGKGNAGTLRIIFGTGTGLDMSSTISVDQLTANVPGAPEAEDRFGEQLAVGDINGDGNDDLVVTTIGEQISGSSDRGSIHVLYGPFTDAPADSDYIDSAHVDGIGEFSGSALALGNFDDDPYLDVAVGVSDQKVGEVGAAGSLAVFYAGADGLTHRNVEVIHQDTPGIGGAPEPEDYFASDLAAGDIDGDGIDDLVVGMRSEAIGSATGSGSAMVLFGNADGGISSADSVWIDQDVEGVPGTVAKDDHFGWTVGIIDIDDDGHAEPLIGAPGNAAGTVTVLKVDRGALVSAQAYAQADLGLGNGVNGDAFGIALPK